MNKVRSGGTGYTIIETMVFLAVSGALFLTAMLVVNGQQHKTEFSTGVRDFDSKLQSIMGNVASGYYANSGNAKCVDGGGFPKFPGGTTPQGQNEACTFIGKWMNLTPDKATFTSYAGLRLDSSGKEVQSISLSPSPNVKPIPGSSEDYIFKDNISGNVTASMKDIASGSTLATLAFTTTFSQYTGSKLDSGSSRVNILAINGAGSIVSTNPSQGVQICLDDGGGKVGIIIINNGSTNLTIGSGCP